jgi:hypothetical protein
LVQSLRYTVCIAFPGKLSEQIVKTGSDTDNDSGQGSCSVFTKAVNSFLKFSTLRFHGESEVIDHFKAFNSAPFRGLPKEFAFQVSRNKF